MSRPDCGHAPSAAAQNGIARPGSAPVRPADEGLPLLERNSALSDAIGLRELPLRHRVSGHPLFEREGLAKLAASLPPGAVERRATRPPSALGRSGRFTGAVAETVRNIEREQCWVILKNVEQMSEYRSLINAILDEVAPCIPAREGRMKRREAFVFIVSTPGATIPAHLDPEHNVFLQIHGRTEVHVGRFPDRDWKAGEIARFYASHYDDPARFPPESSVFSLGPGEGYYNYPWAPHWLVEGTGVSVALSLTFRTGLSERFERVSSLNSRLRRLGVPVRPAGESAIADRGKAAVAAFLGWVRRRGRRQRGGYDFR